MFWSQENLILIKKMSKKCSTAQMFIRTEMTTYRIGTLAGISEYFKSEEFSPFTKWVLVGVKDYPCFSVLVLYIHLFLFSRMQVQAVEDMKELYHHKNERLARRDLMRLTWTSKHRWFGKSMAQKIKFDLDKESTRERPYL